MLSVTPVAVEKLKEVLQEEGQAGTPVRVIAVPGENGGVRYMMTLEKEIQADDQTFTVEDVTFVMDSFSAPYLDEATIDYVENFPRAGFTISNPKFAHGCACGGHCDCGGH